jgi:hypothetical protein
MKRLIVIVVILAVIVVMALRGCPRARRSAGISHNPATADLTGIARPS